MYCSCNMYCSCIVKFFSNWHFSRRRNFCEADANFSESAKVKRNYFRPLYARSPRCFRSCCFAEKLNERISRRRIFFTFFPPLLLLFLSRAKRFTREFARRAHFRTTRSTFVGSYGSSAWCKQRNEKERKRHPPFVLRSSLRRGRWNQDTRMRTFVCACVCVCSLVRANASTLQH